MKLVGTLSSEEIQKILVLKQEGKSIPQIARMMKRTKTICKMAIEANFESFIVGQDNIDKMMDDLCTNYSYQV